MPKLNQVLAIEKGVKNRVNSALTKLYHAAQKEQLFDGFSKTYQAKDADGENFPPEQKQVQFRAGQVLKDIQKHLVELMDITSTKDWANCEARADIEIDGEVVLANVPVTYLLFLDKQLEHLNTMMTQMPTLDTALRWQADDNLGVFVSDPQTSHKTKKVQKPIVLYDATPEHPAQTQLITEDVVIGHWTSTYSSGRMQLPKKEEILERVVKLQQAVKQAREKANEAEATHQKVGDVLLGYIFK